jgi:hypothetical protein
VLGLKVPIHCWLSKILIDVFIKEERNRHAFHGLEILIAHFKILPSILMVHNPWIVSFWFYHAALPGISFFLG